MKIHTILITIVVLLVSGSLSAGPPTVEVEVINPHDQPVPTYDVDAINPDYAHKTVRVTGLIDPNETFAGPYDLYVVPAGKKYVIQYISIAALTSPGIDISAFLDIGGRFWLPTVPVGSNRLATLPNRHVWTMPLRQVVRSGLPVRLGFSLTGAGNTVLSGIQGTIVGYLIDE